jgi:hypothetical protein
MPRSDVPYFGHSWHTNCSGIEKIAPDRRARFLICLYFSVLVDQAVHAHFHHFYSQFEELTRYPKFCHGLGQFQKNPRELLDRPPELGFVERDDILALLPEGMRLFVDEVIQFSNDCMPELSPKEFFEKLIWDPDVQIPLLVVVVQPALRDAPAFRAYESLTSIVKEKFSDS